MKQAKNDSGEKNQGVVFVAPKQAEPAKETKEVKKLDISELDPDRVNRLLNLSHDNLVVSDELIKKVSAHFKAKKDLVLLALHLIGIIQGADARAQKAINQNRKLRTMLEQGNVQVPMQVQAAQTMGRFSPRHGNSQCDNVHCNGGVHAPTGTDCVRCGGKGYQDQADRRRNWGYDQNNRGGRTYARF